MTWGRGFCMQEQRPLEIIRILLQSSGFITIQQIATMLQVSNKTIRNDLQTVSDWLNENEMTLCKKTGSGICIEGDPKKKLHLLEQILGNNRRPKDYTPQARKTYIGLRLINCVERCRVYELSSELFVSRATIHKDLIALQPMLAQYRITLMRKSNHGVRLEGKEHNLRALMFALMTADKGYQMLAELVRTRSCQQPDRFLFSALDYTEQDFYHILQALLQAQNRYWHELPFTTMLECFLQICILCLRVMDEKKVVLSRAFVEELEKKPLYQEACELCDLMEQHLHISLPEDERRYLQIHLLALQNQQPDHGQQDVIQMTHDLLTLWSRIFGRSFEQDEDLKTALQAHLGPAITRCRHGIRIENPLMYEIRSYYKNTFQIVQRSLRLLEPQYGCQFSDDEAGYLSIHLAAALDRVKEPLRTILICHQGPASCNLIVRKLSQQVPEIEIVSKQTFISIEQTDLSNIDLILSTLPLTLACDIPVLTLQALPRDHDIQRVKSIIETYYKQKNDPLRYADISLLEC